MLGDEIRALTQDLFSGRLTPEEEERRIDETAIALENRQLQEEQLESEAAHLTAYGDYILHQVRAARQLHRSISARDLRSYVTDFFDVHYVGSEFRRATDDAMRFDVSLSVDARHDFAAYLRKQRIDSRTWLTRDTAGRVPCRFENTAVPDPRGREEVISQFHPLVRFVSERLDGPQERRRPAVAIRMAANGGEGALGPGRYVFSVQRWSVRGLRDMERLYYAAAPVGARARPLEPQAAERLIVGAASGGVAGRRRRGRFRRDQSPAFPASRTRAIRSAAVSHSMIHSPTWARRAGSATPARASARRPAVPAPNLRAA